MKILDLFSGCGGMSLGFQAAGFEVVAAVDNWEPAIEIYRSNFDHQIYNVDLADPDRSRFLSNFSPDIIVGGPPCQDFSISGKRQEGKRANLTIRFAEIVGSIRPLWVVFENVYNITRFETLKDMQEILRDAGYGISAQVLDASFYGVPQARKRYFLVAKRGEIDGFFDEWFFKSKSTTPMTVRDYLGDELGTQYYYMHPRSYARRGVFSIDEPAATIRGINRPIPENYKQHRADAAPISAGVRALTSEERAWLQSFPRDFLLPGAKTNVELAIGNAVPPELARFVGTCIQDYTKSSNDQPQGGQSVLF